LSMRMRALQNWTEAVSEASSHPNIFSQLANLSVGFWKLKMVQASKDLIRDDLIYLSRNVQSYPKTFQQFQNHLHSYGSLPTPECFITMNHPIVSIVPLFVCFMYPFVWGL